MNTRFHCIAPAQSIVTSQAICASWPEPASFLDPGEAYYGLPHHSIAEPSTSTAGSYERTLRDRRDARMDAVGTGLAVDIHNVFAGTQALAVGQAQFRPAAARIAGQFVSASLASAARNWQRVFSRVWWFWSFVAPKLSDERKGERLDHLGGQIAP